MQALQSGVIDAISIPAGDFTGDFYFTIEHEDALWFAVGDVAGKGLHAAIYMAMIQEELERVIRSCSAADPAEVVACLHRSLVRELPDNRFATLVVGRLLPDYRLQLVNAGHCHPIVLRSDGSLEIIGSDGPIVGILPCPRWEQRTLSLNRGDVFVAYTDGVLEATSASGEEFGLARVVDAVRHGSPVESLRSAVIRFAGNERHDDLTIFALECGNSLPPSPPQFIAAD